MSVNGAATSDPAPLSARQASRQRIIALSRGIVAFLLLSSFALFFTRPDTALEWALEILARSYLMFLCSVMAHEGSHGHLGRSRASNDWWGRLALVPSLVPYLNFRKTHRMHHSHTNIPHEDPDYFVKPRHWIEVPFRSVAVPHYWVMWLRKRGWLDRRDWIELGLHYLAMGAVYGTLSLIVGFDRLALSMVPSLVLTSILLWYPFAVKTHEGFSTGAQEERSHNYYGHFMYWLSLGLGMHRVHHMKPGLTWLELLPYVERAPRGVRFGRDVRTPVKDPA